jgi:hypothetical protein
MRGQILNDIGDSLSLNLPQLIALVFQVAETLYQHHHLLCGVDIPA